MASKPLTEVQARKAVQAYFREYSALNGYEFNPEGAKLRGKGRRWDIGNGWTFTLFYGGRPVWVREQADGLVVVWRQEMPEITLHRRQLKP